ncbi:TPA: hypothetical protein QDB51_003506 [Burkholderia vietnamiensis]|nr:hypothetical protein [Burkholderia vietnamiensis]
MKHLRGDLNLAHLVARSGVSKDVDASLLVQRNKNDWLPVHLAKNTHIAEILMRETAKHLPLVDIVLPCIRNNAQSIQTQYGTDLEIFLMEQGFTTKEAKQGAVPPSTRERIELAKLYLSLVDPTWLQQFDFNPLEVALSHCNSYFLFALHTQPESLQKDLVEAFRGSIQVKIGSAFYLSDRAFQVKQQLKQFWGIHVPITTVLPTNYGQQTDDALKNLEGA